MCVGALIFELGALLRFSRKSCLSGWALCRFPGFVPFAARILGFQPGAVHVPDPTALKSSEWLTVGVDCFGQID